MRSRCIVCSASSSATGAMYRGAGVIVDAEQAELANIAAHGRLRDGKASALQLGHEILLGADDATANQREDGAVARRLRGRTDDARCARAHPPVSDAATASNALPKRSTACRPQSRVMTSGGTRRSVRSPIALTISPSSSAAAATSRAMSRVERDPEHQPAAANPSDGCAAIRERAQRLGEIVANLRRVLDEPLALDRPHHRDRGRARKRSAAERRAVVAGLEDIGARRGEDRPDRERRRRGPWRRS